VVLAGSIVGCAASSSPTPDAALPARGPAPASATAASAPGAPSQPSAAPPSTPPLGALPVTIARELDAPVRRLAIDRPPHVAALTARSVWVHDAKGWREQALPPALASDATLELDVFYGRDYRVRLVGYRGPPAARVPVYLRWLPGGFKAAADELGQLGARKSGVLVAVLGTADPEIVCLPGDACLVKRLSGWSRAGAPPDLSRLAIADGAGFAVAGKQLLKLAPDWSSAAPPGSWDRADALFVQGTSAWVLESERDRIHRLDGSAWQTESSPLPRPRALLAVTSPEETSLWLAADGGLARRDAGVWRRVSELSTPVVTLAARTSDEVWAGGAEGLFKVRLAAAAQR